MSFFNSWKKFKAFVKSSQFPGGAEPEIAVLHLFFALIAAKNCVIVDSFFWVIFFDKYLIKFELNSSTCDNS